MNKDEILTGLYDYLIEHVPNSALNLILANDIRVENFFVIYAGLYFERLLAKNQLLNYKLFPSFTLDSKQRLRVDIIFKDLENEITLLELKHFPLSNNKGSSHRISYYTKNTMRGKKNGVVAVCEKLDALRNNALIKPEINIVCCALTTPKLMGNEALKMRLRFVNYPEMNGWKLSYPITLLLQHRQLGMFILENN